MTKKEKRKHLPAIDNPRMNILVRVRRALDLSTTIHRDPFPKILTMIIQHSTKTSITLLASGSGSTSLEVALFPCDIAETFTPDLNQASKTLPFNPLSVLSFFNRNARNPRKHTRLCT